MRGTFIAWHGVAKSIGADLASCPQFRFEDQRKKGLRREILGSVLTFTRFFFRSGKYFYSRWGAQAVFWGAHALKCTSEAPGLLLSFGAQSSLGGQKQYFGGHGPKMFLCGDGPV